MRLTISKFSRWSGAHNSLVSKRPHSARDFRNRANIESYSPARRIYFLFWFRWLVVHRERETFFFNINAVFFFFFFSLFGFFSNGPSAYRESRGRRAVVNSSRNIPDSSLTRFNGESPSPIQKLNGRRRVQFREIGRPCRKAQGTFPLRSIGFLAGARRIAESGIL